MKPSTFFLHNFVSNNETWYYLEVKKLFVMFLCYVMHKRNFYDNTMDIINSMDQINWSIYAF